MVKIRLYRKGKKGSAHFRIVVVDARRPRDGKFIEDLGYYNPHTKDFNVNVEKSKVWLKHGAQPSDTVGQYFVKLGILKEWRKTKRSILAQPKSKTEEKQT